MSDNMTSPDEYLKEIERLKKELAKAKNNSSTPIQSGNTFNPYVGFDIPSAFSMAGAAAQSGNWGNLAITGGKALLGSARNFFSGYAASKRNQQFNKDAYDKAKQSAFTTTYFDEGGEMSLPPELISMLSQQQNNPDPMHPEKVTGLDSESDQYNAELEKDEFLKDKKGNVMQVEGDKHDKGGEKMMLEDGDRVLSDQKKVGKRLAKRLKEELGLKIKADNTYAEVLEMYTKKLGIHKKAAKLEELMLKIEDQTKVKDKATRALNVEVIEGRLNEVMKEKSELDMKKVELFDRLFDAQEKTKKKGKKNDEVFAKGGEKGDPVKRFQDRLEAASSKEQKEQILKELKMHFDGDKSLGLQYMSEKNPIVNKRIYDRWEKESSSPFYKKVKELLKPEKISPDKYDEWSAEAKPTYAYGDVDAGQSYLLNSVFKGDKDAYSIFEQEAIRRKPEIKGDKKRIQEEVIGLQRTVLDPNLTAHYGDNVYPTQKGLQLIYDHPDVPTETKVKLKKTLDSYNLMEDNKVLGGLQDRFKANPEQYSKIKGIMNTVPDGVKEIVSENNIHDGKWYYRHMKQGEIEFDSPEKMKEWLDKKGGDLVKGVDGDLWYAKKDGSGSYVKVSAKTPEKVVKKVKGDKEKDKEKKDYKAYGLSLLGAPDMMPLPPSAMENVTKLNARYDRLEPNRVEVEPYLQELQAGRENSNNRLEGLPENVRLAMQSNNDANYINQLSNIMTRVDERNIRSQDTADKFNATTQAREMDMNNNYLADFDKKTKMTQSKYDAAINQYYQYGQALNKQNYMDIENLNLANQLGEDYKYVNGQIINVTPKSAYIDQLSSMVESSKKVKK